jgi:hypothetical protein
VNKIKGSALIHCSSFPFLEGEGDSEAMGGVVPHPPKDRTMLVHTKKAAPERRPYLVQTGCLLTARPRFLIK